MQEINKEKSSFRDPDGHVFYKDGQVYRSIAKSRAEFFQGLLKEPVVLELIADGSLIPTNEHEIKSEAYIVSHQYLDLLTYPYEWSLTQLIDAALLTLKVQQRLLTADLCLKDATPYNVQFSGHRAIFIDFTSIEANQGRQVWRALNQFLEMFYYPILLHYYGKVNLKKTYLDNFNGIKVNEVKDALGTLTSFSFENILQIGLPYLFRNSQSAAPKASTDLTEQQKAINIRTQAFTIEFFIKRLTKLQQKHLRNLAKDESIWSHYTTDIHYGNNAYEFKHNIVKDLINKCRPQRLIDLGCNTGDFSICASKLGARVFSVDLDINCIDRLYSRAKADDLTISPIWMHLDNPSPAIGWQNHERKSFIDRVSTGFKADMVLALALVHHLIVSSSVPVSGVMEFLYSLTQRYVIIEFVEYADPMFQKIISSRDDIYQHINCEFFENTIADSFTIVQSQSVTETRKIYLLEKK